MIDERVSADWLTDFVYRVFCAAGVPTADAGVIAEHLVHAELRGVVSHGVSRVRVYTERLRTGVVEPYTRIETLRETPVSAHLDGGNGPGIVVGGRAMDLAMDKARGSGIGMVAVKGSNHCGMLAHYTSHAAGHGLIALATTSAPATMAPWGARQPYFGTNPLSYGIPTGDEIDIVFDMATSRVARGKIILAERSGRTIPLGWAMNTDGMPTTDAAEALDGFVLPVGEPKGSGLAFFVEVLSAVLPGANIGPHIPPLYDNPDRAQGVGHFFLAFRTDLFAAPDEFTRRMDQTIKEIRVLPAAPEHERVLLPGEIETELARRQRRDGIPLAEEVRADLDAVAREYGVSP